MTNLQLLVTGGAGYIGAVLVPELLEEGHHVTVLDTFFYGTDPSTDPIVHERCDKVPGDIRDFALVDRVLEEGRFDAVIHLAAISNDPSSELDHEVAIFESGPHHTAIRYHPGLGEYVLIFAYGFGTDIFLRRAPRPEGPWSS